MKKAMIILAVVLIILYLIILLFFYHKQEALLFHPSKTAQDFQYKYPTAFEEKFYETPNQGKIHTLYFKAENPKGVILYFHGNAGNLEDWGWVYQNFVKLNYDIEIIDYRTFGKSTGKLSEKNFHTDAKFIFNKLKENYKEENIVIYGRSIGTGIATKLASETKSKILILETPYFNIADLVNSIVPFIPAKLLLKYQFESNKFITKVNAPIYILHGTTDEVIPFKNGQKLFNLVKDKAEFISFENGTHSNLGTFSEFGLFLERVLE